MFMTTPQAPYPIAIEGQGEGRSSKSAVLESYSGSSEPRSCGSRGEGRDNYQIGLNVDRLAVLRPIDGTLPWPAAPEVSAGFPW